MYFLELGGLLVIIFWYFFQIRDQQPVLLERLAFYLSKSKTENWGSKTQPCNDRRVLERVEVRAAGSPSFLDARKKLRFYLMWNIFVDVSSCVLSTFCFLSICGFYIKASNFIDLILTPIEKFIVEEYYKFLVLKVIIVHLFFLYSR